MADVAGQYLPILLFLGVAAILAALFVLAPLAVSQLTGTDKPYDDKLAEYECGFPAFESARRQFDVRFYLVAILFIIFDLEVAFFFPWVASLAETGWHGWWVGIIFLGILTVGFIYEWKKGALEWE
ncbi:MAG: NADH-quinone oxidoreductase subunit A [Sphingomonadaceae bacterium]|jgi:NADH-quinone oxidoreductase subunit A